MLCVNISDITIIAVKRATYRCVTHNISNTEAIHLLKISLLDDCGCKSNACQRDRY